MIFNNKQFVFYTALFVAGLLTGILLKESRIFQKNIQKTNQEENKPDTKEEPSKWPKAFQQVEIESPIDGHLQKAYFHPTQSDIKKPLIVSLHSWSGDYTQKDTLAFMSKSEGMNYIHPNFRGPNWTTNACCSDLALRDIEASIDYAVQNGNVDTSRIYLIGGSGGGYATLCMYMKSTYNIQKYSAWVPISDLVAWYHESKIRGNKYAGDILDCTGSRGAKLNKEEAMNRSPIYWEIPLKKAGNKDLRIYSGIYDGIQGSVPITQSINFYNKCLNDLGVTDSSKYVSPVEKLNLLEKRRPLGHFGKLGGRSICLQKSYEGIQLTIFKGNHEMLPAFAINHLLE